VVSRRGIACSRGIILLKLVAYAQTMPRLSESALFDLGCGILQI